MSVKYPSHLYIRIDHPLRAGLISAAEAAGQSVSAFARGILRGTISQRSERPSTGDRAVTLRSGAVSEPDRADPLLFRGTVRQAEDGDA